MNRKAVWFGVAGLVLVIAGILLGRHFFPVTHRAAEAPSSGNVLLAPAPPLEDPGLMRAQAETPPEPEKPRPPADVMDYLNHLRNIELQRQAMQRDLTPALNALVNAMAMRATLDEQQMQQRMSAVQQTPQDYAQRWAQLSQLFETKQPPPSCQALHGAYRKMLASTVAYMTKIYLALQQAQTDPNAALQVLSQMQGTASSDVDAQIMQANIELQRVIDEHNLRSYFPDFTIRSDSALNLRSIFGG